MSQNNVSLNLNASQIFNHLDAKDGKTDQKINAKEWNDFAAIVGGKTIKYCIKEKNAIKSINYYLNKLSDETEKSVADFLGVELKNNIKNENVSQKAVDKNLNKKSTTLPAKTNKKETANHTKTTSKSTIKNENAFEQDTMNLNKRKFTHSTRFLEVAQDSLGLYEITALEYNRMKKENPEELKNTQAIIVGDFGMRNNHQWCAYTVGYLAQRAGLNIGKYSSVQTYIDKFQKDYNQISRQKMTKENYKKERIARANEIEKQLPKMNEGDFIIWKGDYVVPKSNGTVQKSTASHIGIIENVDLENGIVTVIEGNANISEMNENQERVPVRTSADCKRGAQTYGEYKDVNNRDGLIRKQYTIEELSKHGYTGFISNKARMK